MNAVSEAPELLFDVNDRGIAHIILNRPRAKNTVSFATWEQFSAALDVLENATSARLLIISGAEGGKGADVIYDPVGGALADPAFRTIAWDGRYLVIGFAAGDIPAIPLNLPLVKGAAIVGVFWGAFLARDRDVNAANIEQLYLWYEAGALRPEISRHFAFEQGAEAIRWIMDRKALGKVVIEMPN